MNRSLLFHKCAVAVLSLSLLGLSETVMAAPNDALAKRLANPERWTVWPSDSSSTVTSLDEGGEKVLLLNSDKATSIYQYAPMEPNSLYRIEFWYKAKFGQPPNGTLKVTFRRKGAGKAFGDKRFPLDLGPGAEGWVHRSVVVMSPPEESSAQVAILVGEGEGQLYLKAVRVEREEEATVPTMEGAKAELDPEAEFWKQAPTLGHFWKAEGHGEAAQFPTEVKVVQDRDAFYLRFDNQEPEPELLKSEIHERDGPLWREDSNEIYIATGSQAFQFIVGASGAMWDGRLQQNMDGDPWRPDKSWNGEWESHVQKGKDRWWTVVRIPFETLGERPQAGAVWRVNFARHRYASGLKESSRWIFSEGATNVVERFGYLRFDGAGAAVVRFVEPINPEPLKVDRPNGVYAEVLGEGPGGHHVGHWWHDFFLKSYPKAYAEKYTKASWMAELESKLKQRGEIGSWGPYIPQAINEAGWEIVAKAHETYGMMFPYFMTTSAIDRLAIQKGAKYYQTVPGVARQRVVEFDPAKRVALFEALDASLQKYPDLLKLIAFFDVVDEPSNTMFRSFSRSRRPDAGATLDEVDAEIRANYGGGRYGLYDHFGEQTATSPFERIAFCKWWNARMDEWARDVRLGLRQRAPEIPVLMSNHNMVARVPFVDFPLQASHTDKVAVDPYPTAVLALHGRARALYHTGFSTKFLHDLSDGKEVKIMPQGFEYHGKAPSPNEVREWASQAMKNGASTLFWYTSGPAALRIPETFEEILQIDKQVKTMAGLKLPEKTRTTIFHSLASQTGLNDEVLHGAYTLYSILGERIGSWFRFSGERGAEVQDLKGYDLIYVPLASYLSEGTAEALLERAREGATVVFFDPLSLSSSELGEPLVSQREGLIGGALGKRRAAEYLSVEGGVIPEFPNSVRLPLTPVAQGLWRGRVLAHDVDVPADAKVFARYEDGRPAGYSRAVGKGRVIYFAAQPFGNSDLAIAASPWEPFFLSLAKGADEPVGLPIWRFSLEKQS